MSFTRIALETHDTDLYECLCAYARASQLGDIFKTNTVTCKTDVYKCGTNNSILHTEEESVPFLSREQ
jgi:hypothetical protein